MPATLPPHVASAFRSLGSKFSCRVIKGNPPPEARWADGHTACDVFDSATGQHYCTAYGPTEEAAIEAAALEAVNAPKPLTPAQAHERAHGVRAASAQHSEAQARIAALEAELADARAKLAARVPEPRTGKAGKGKGGDQPE